jgi:hypothetical protein
MLRNKKGTLLAALLLLSAAAHAANPRWMNIYGRYPIWPGGQVVYYTDAGDLSASVNQAAANTLVAAAAAPWSAVIAAGVTITQGGVLHEDVNGTNVYLGNNGIVWPADVQNTNTGRVAVIYDADGAVTDLLLGAGASAPANCRQNAVTESVDGFDSSGNISHALIILNGRCTGPAPEQQLQMQYQLERVFGRVLGVGWSQLNDNVFTGTPAPQYTQMLGWPIMHPIDILCGPYTYQCLPNPFQLRMDDRSALRQIYWLPQNAAQWAQLPLASATQTIGTVSFPSGQGMQGVNVVAQRMFPGVATVDPQELVSSVTGGQFTQNNGDPVSGYTDAGGNALRSAGMVQMPNEGAYNIASIEMDASVPWLNIVLTPEPVNPLYVGEYSIGPAKTNTVTPSGTLATKIVYVSGKGSPGWMNFVVGDAANDLHSGADGTETAPASIASGGWESGRLTGYGHTAWYGLHVQGGRTLTVETTALDESGNMSMNKALPLVGVWNATDAIGSLPDVSVPQAFNSMAAGTTSLPVQVANAEQMRIAVADARGDGRPDYAYQMRVLYADSIAPAQLSAKGGTVTISGMGFRAGLQVTVNGVAAKVLQSSATQIVATAPALSAFAGSPTSLTADVMVSDPTTGGSTTMTGALLYGSLPVTPGPVTTPQLMVVSGGAQSVLPGADFAPVMLEVTDGAGNGVANALVQIYQTVTGWQAACLPSGQCPQPPVYATANIALVSDASGQVSFQPAEVAGAELTQIVATALTNGLVQMTLQKQP